jgi:hypothetical protein
VRGIPTCRPDLRDLPDIDFAKLQTKAATLPSVSVGSGGA